MAKSIMYVGRKDQKVDNKTPNPNRVWRGLGQVIENIPDLEAAKLASHPDIWMDVTKMSKADRASIIAALQERYRAEKRKAREGQAILLEQASEEELEAALTKLRKGRGKAEDNPVDPKRIQPSAPIGTMSNAQDERHRPTNTEDLGEEIFGVITALDREQDFDPAGKPYLERVSAKLGYTVTQAELDAVWAVFNEQG